MRRKVEISGNIFEVHFDTYFNDRIELTAVFFNGKEFRTDDLEIDGTELEEVIQMEIYDILARESMDAAIDVAEVAKDAFDTITGR
jgi:hypothetical protein